LTSTSSPTSPVRSPWWHRARASNGPSTTRQEATDTSGSRRLRSEAGFTPAPSLSRSSLSPNSGSCASTRRTWSGRPAGALELEVSTGTPPTLPCSSPTSPPGSVSAARARGASTRTRRWPSTCCGLESARLRRQRYGPEETRLGGSRSGAGCGPTRCGPSPSSGTRYMTTGPDGGCRPRRTCEAQSMGCGPSRRRRGWRRGRGRWPGGCPG